MQRYKCNAVNESTANAQQQLSLDSLVRFDAAKRTAGMQLTDDCCVARNTTGRYEWVLCAVPSDRFEVRIRRSQQPRGLCIGFAAPDAPLDDWNAFWKQSFLIYTYNSQLYERGNWGPIGKSNIRENAVVSVANDFAHRALVFRVDGNELFDTAGKPYGRRETGLSAEQFAALVGAVQMRWKDDEVEIVQ